MNEKELHFLETFRLHGDPKGKRFHDLASTLSIEMSKEILELIKAHKPTYEEAYTSLQIVYEILKYESNFVPIN